MDSMTKHCTITMVNMITAAHADLPVYTIQSFKYEEIETSGVCIFFDYDMNMLEVIASDKDIVVSAFKTLNADDMRYYCLIVDDIDPLSKIEILELFYGLEKGEIHLHSIDIPYKIEITLSQN